MKTNLRYPRKTSCYCKYIVVMAWGTLNNTNMPFLYYVDDKYNTIILRRRYYYLVYRTFFIY